jgi:hypothetical protein
MVGRIKLEKTLYFNVFSRKTDKKTEREKNEVAILSLVALPRACFTFSLL